MDKKQFTSWGVSFGSIALVAGMVSYLGIHTPSKTNKNNDIVNQIPAASQSSIQPQQGGDDQNTLDDNSSAETFGNDNQGTDDNGAAFFDNSNSQQQNVSPFDGGGGFGRHQRNFDTTTGGS